MASRKGRKGEAKGAPGSDQAIGQRVRARPERKCPEKADRVRHIMGLMAKGQWITGVTSYDLAKRWRVHPDTVHFDSAEASRRVRDVTTDDEIRAQIMLTLQTITSRAMTKGELRTAVESVKALAGITGVEAPKTVNVGGSLAEILALAMAPSGDEPPPPVG